MLNTPFSPWPSFTPEEAKAVSDVLLSNRVNVWTGSEVKTFEEEFAAWVGGGQAIALTNGTLALDLALKGLRIGAHNGGSATDEVIVTPRSFIASVSCVINAGAIPVFADVDRESGNISAGTIAAKLSKNTKAVLPVHLAGWPCDMPAIMALAEDAKFAVIEDCAQAHGAKIDGKSVGAWGHVGAWSFCQDKIMTTGGEGGMVTCRDDALWSRMWSFKDHGKSFDAVFKREHPPGFRWLHESIGTNWRMLEMQAAIGRIQLGRMATWHKQRCANAEQIWEAARQHKALRAPLIPTEIEHGCYRAYIYVEPRHLKPRWSRDRIVAEIKAQGVPCYQGTCSEIYLEKAFDGTDFRPAAPLPIAHELGETSLMFLVHPTLLDEHITKTVEVLHKVMDAASY